MAISNLVSSTGLSNQRFMADYNKPFQIPAGLTLQNTVTSTTTFSAGALPAQVWIVAVGGGGAGGKDGAGSGGGGGGGTLIGWADVPSAGVTVTIGSGGVGGAVGSASNAYTGNAGGNTYFGSLIAFGGGGGQNINAQYDNNADGDHSAIIPRGTGAGYGGFGGNLFASGGTRTFFPFVSGCAPFAVESTIATVGTSYDMKGLANWRKVNKNNYTGGGAGGVSDTYDNSGAAGGSGLTGGGGGGANVNGGNSSRNGGISNTYTGGTGNASGLGGGGAGLLANGSNATASAAGAGGSGGGGGGGGSSWTYTVGNGGNGCVLIYY